MELLFANNQSSIVTSDRILYTPSNFARTSLLHLQEIGTLKANKPHISRRDNLNSYLFFMVHSGSGKLVYNNIEYEIYPGDCAFIDCRKAYSHSTDIDLWTLSWIHFYGPSLSNIYEKYRERGGLNVFHPKDMSEFQSTWKYLFSIAASSDYIRDMKINDELNHLIMLLMSESWHPERNMSPKSSRRLDIIPVKEYLDSHYAEKIFLKDLSKKFFISSAYLNRSFKAQFGTSVNTYLQQIRITKAKQMLRFTQKKIEEIGFECGLGAPTYFSRVFKKIEGIPPSEYREKW